jgi:hypothetical protein
VEHHRDIDRGCHASKEACCKWQSLHHQVPHKKNMIHMKKKIIARDHGWMLQTLQIAINTP